MFKQILLAILLASVSAQAAAQRCPREMATRTYPGRAWQQATATSQGWDSGQLDAAMERAAASFSAGLVVYRGRVIGQFGEVDLPMETRSMRKAFLNAVIGQLVAEGRLRLGATLAELGVDDVTPLTPVERSATLRTLLTSRSGIYLPAAYVVPGDETDRPPRGAHRPGEAFYYWNWGFNALGGIVERTTGRSVFASFEARIARPLGLQDFNSTRDTRYVREPVSQFPAYLFDISTRDRARIGLLYLNRGCWRGRQIVSPDWVSDSIAPITNQDRDFDYGYLWWSSEPPSGTGLRERIFMARGFANQYIVGIPEIETVLVLSVDMARGRQRGLRPPRRRDFEETFGLVVSARPAA